MDVGRLALGVALALGAVVAPPGPTSFVTDQASFLSAPARQALEQRLSAHERQTGQQVIVWIGDPELGGSLEEWAARTFQAWGVGR